VCEGRLACVNVMSADAYRLHSIEFTRRHQVECVHCTLSTAVYQLQGNGIDFIIRM
jgi:hypothetical protein